MQYSGVFLVDGCSEEVVGNYLNSLGEAFLFVSCASPVTGLSESLRHYHLTSQVPMTRFKLSRSLRAFVAAAKLSDGPEGDQGL